MRVLFDLGPGRWNWLNTPYAPNATGVEGIQLGELHVGDGRQWVRWERREGDTWVTGAPSWLFGYRKTVGDACWALRQYGWPGHVFRLVRFDRTPLLTVRRHPTRHQWYVRPWGAS